MKLKVGNRHLAAVKISSLANSLLPTVCCLLLTFSAFAQKAIPELWGQRVHDEAHALQQATVDQLENNLKAYEDSTSNQIAILIIQSLDGEVLEEYSLRVAEKWKLGQKGKDNGVLLLISVDDHKMRIEVGQGLEGVLTDALSNRIIRNEIAPAFRRGEFDAGVIAGIDGIIKGIGGEYSADDSSDLENMSLKEKILFGLFIYGVLGIFTLICVFVYDGMGWGLFAFLIPFYGLFGWIPFGSFEKALWVTPTYIGVIGILKLMLNYSRWGKNLRKKWEGNSKKRWSSSGSGSSSRRSSSSSSWSSSSSDSSWSSSDSSSSFDGGGGSFGGGGSSGGW
jgi:uncharacterized protein